MVMSSANAGALALRAGVLGERNFRRFFVGYASSLIGSAMVPVALSFAVLDQGKSALDVGYVLAARTVPLIALLIVGGAVADRLSRRITMLSADLVRCVSEGTLAVLLLSGPTPLWALMLLGGVLGAGQAFFNPAMTGLIPELVSDGSLRSANALRGIAVSSGQIIGPSLAGVIVAAGGAGWAIAIDAATYLVSFSCLVRLELPARLAGAPERLVTQLARGWREFRSRTWLWAIVAQFATFNAICFAPFMVLGAVAARSSLGGAGAWGAILAALGVGSILGGVLATRIPARRPLITATIGTSAFALPQALLAIPANALVVAAAAGVAGIGLAVFSTVWETALQRRVPAEVLSRVSAYDWLGSVAFVPVGYLLAGPMAAGLGLRQTLLVGSAWTVLSCAAVLAVPSIRTLNASADPAH